MVYSNIKLATWDGDSPYHIPLPIRELIKAARLIESSGADPGFPERRSSQRQGRMEQKRTFWGFSILTSKREVQLPLLITDLTRARGRRKGSVCPWSFCDYIPKTARPPGNHSLPRGPTPRPLGLRLTFARVSLAPPPLSGLPDYPTLNFRKKNNWSRAEIDRPKHNICRREFRDNGCIMCPHADVWPNYVGRCCIGSVATSVAKPDNGRQPPPIEGPCSTNRVFSRR